jgi:hypothetical protein
MILSKNNHPTQLYISLLLHINPNPLVKTEKDETRFNRTKDKFHPVFIGRIDPDPEGDIL